ncbi:MAG: outer membrane beta-barrel protein [Chitinophagaceae bacterium]|nr:outer membrane beta-barrel protein [Chitinophagaceae bacterium]
MKKLLVMVLCLASFAAMGQTKKGDKMVGVGIGSISYTNSDSKTSYSNTPTVYNSDGNSFSISVNPNVAWFVQDNLAIGGGVSISFYSSKSNSSNTSSTTTSESKSTQPSFYIGPLARYYFGGSSKGQPFGQINLQYGIYGGKSESKTSTGASSETTTKPKGDWNAGISFGYEHFITPNVGFYGSIGFNYGSSKTEYQYRPSTGTGYDYTSEYSRFYIPVNVGLQVHILNKKGKK